MLRKRLSSSSSFGVDHPLSLSPTEPEPEYHVCDLRNDEDNKFSCIISDYYYPVRKRYIFRLSARNDMGINIQYFLINNHKIGK